MKIQVTFEKNAKKEFREECVKRLKSFVHQIKSQKQNKPNPMAQKSDQIYQMLLMDKATIQNSLSKTNNNKEQKAIKLYQQSFIDQKQPKSRSIQSIRKTQQKQNSNCTISKFIAGDIRIQDKDEKNTSMKQMSDKVNKILQRFQNSQKLNRENSNKIEQALQLTNRKLDYLIQIAQKKIHPFNDTPQALNFQVGCKQTRKEEFQQKFLELTQRYNKILQNDIPLKSSFYRAQYSPQQTRDSLTFRQI